MSDRIDLDAERRRGLRRHDAERRQLHVLAGSERRTIGERRASDRRGVGPLVGADSDDATSVSFYLPTHRALQGLLEMVRQTVADGVVTLGETEELVEWVDQHPEIAGVWPVPTLARRLRILLADGRFDEQERSEMLATLRELVGQDRAIPRI
jgi:hypothetical protein